ncbi:putative afadin isoform X3 [Apostichopus japonicus]|uniref:Putative afadin isoform X3 n=1 Tax=Stichopus japonicus TaxID=307972 RepID=A0A2G8KXQ3_STIJA|nr:putative afadin isoform X3 [Apostichopus japonicus]
MSWREAYKKMLAENASQIAGNGTSQAFVAAAIKLFAMEKTSRATLEAACSQAARLNSRQLGTLLEMYQHGPGETQIPREIITEEVNDEADVNIGRPLVREEDPELRIPIIIAEDGYSSDIVKDIPNGLPEFLDPLVRSGMVRFSVNAMAIGTWTIYMHARPPTPEPIPESPVEPKSPPPAINNETGKPMPQVKADARPPPEKREPDVVIIDLDKGSSPSMGLSIVALKAPTQEQMSIYVKAVVPGGAGAKDGRIKAGDQILEVDGNNIVGLDRDEATKFLVKSGRVVRLTIAQQGAIFHGLAGILSQPSPPMQRANLGQQQPKDQMPVPQPRNRADIDRRSPTNSDSSHGSRRVERHDWRESSTMPRNPPGMAGLSQADHAKSSPNLAEDRAATLPNNQRYSHFEPTERERVSSVSNSRPAERPRVLQKGGLAQRSKSTSQLDPENFETDGGYPRHSQSSSNLHEPLYKGKAPPEEPPFRGPQGKIFVDQLEHEPSRRLPQPRDEPRPVPQPRGRPNGPQSAGPPRQYGSPFSDSQNDDSVRQYGQSPNGPQQRMPPQGYRPSGPMNQNRINGPPGQPQMMDPRIGQPRVNGPPGPARMNGPPGPARMNGPPGPARMNGPPGPARMNGPPGQARPNGPPGDMRLNGPPPGQQRLPSPMYQGRMASPNQQGLQRSLSSSSAPPYDQPKSHVIETHFPAEPPRSDERRSMEPPGGHYNQSPQPGPQRPEPQNQGPRMRLPPNGQASYHPPEKSMPPPPPPQAIDFEVPFADLPPPPADLTAPANNSGNIPDDFPLPPPPPDVPAWDDELDDYQRMFEEQQRELDRELKLLQEADDELTTVERPAYASLPRQGRINQPSTPLGDQQRPQLQRQPSNGPIPVAIPKAPTSEMNRQKSSGFDTQNLNGRAAAPMSVTSLMPSASVNTSISPSAWDRDEKERKEEWYEEEMLKRKSLEIDDLLRTPNKTPQQEERLRKLQVEVEFQKRVQESRDEDRDSNQEEEQEITRATVKARMVDMVADNTNNSLGNMLTQPPPARGQEKNHSDFMDSQARRLQQLKEERMRQQQDEERMWQQQQQESAERAKRQQNEDTLRRQEEELQRRYEQQRLEYDRREAQIEQERIRLEQQLNLRNGPNQNTNTSPYPQVSSTGNTTNGAQATTQANNNYSGFYQARPYQPNAIASQPIKKAPPLVSSKPALAPKPFVAPKPNLKVQLPSSNGPSYNGQTAPSNNNYAPGTGQTLATPENSQNLNVYRTGETPGVIGAQEVYRDPYERKIMSQRMKKDENPTSPLRPLTFREKMKAFSEDGGTPEKKNRTSKWEQKFLSENPDVLQG